jgi:hypothetical protein
VTLRRDVDVPLDTVWQERVPKEAAEFEATLEFDTEATGEPEPGEPELVASPSVTVPATSPEGAAAEAKDGVKSSDLPAAASPGVLPAAAPMSLIVRDEPPVDYERQLDPRSMKDARILAQDMHASRMFIGTYGTPQGVLSTVMLGRELGLPAMASLRQIHIVEGKHTLSAQLMVALVLKSGLAKYFEPEEFDDKHAVFVTHRKGQRKPVRMEHTIVMAQTAGLVKPNSNWVKVPIDMLCARAQSRLCRMVYPDVVGGLYTPDEIEELRQQQVA